MSKNLIPEICKLLNIKLGEEFKVRSKGIPLFRFCSLGLEKKAKNGDWYADTAETFSKLCQGTEIIIKLPWKPKVEEKYWSFMVRRDYTDKTTWSVAVSIWLDHPVDWALLDKGWVFRTRTEAEAALPKVAAEMGVEYEQ